MKNAPNAHPMARTILTALFSPLVFLCVVPIALAILVRRKWLTSESVTFCYSQVLWDEVWQRPQEYAWRASRQMPVVYCAPVQVHNWLFQVGGRYRPIRHVETDGRRLVILSPLIFSGHFRSAFIFRLNCALVGLICRAYLKRTNLRVLINTPFGLPVLNVMGKDGKPTQIDRVVYDRIDDFTAFAWAPEFSKELDRQLLERADSVIAGTGEIADAIPGTEFIPCGVDYELFSNPGTIPDDIASLPKPIIGYFGTISERLDMDLIARIADRFPEASVVMVGPVHLATTDAPVRTNIHYLGLKPHDRLPDYAHQFDVGLIPFRLTAATMKLNPVKTLEYLAAGVPVVSTAIPDIKRYFSETVGVAESSEEFIELVDAALRNPDKEKQSRGKELARTSSWDDMVARINAHVLNSADEIPKPTSPSGSIA